MCSVVSLSWVRGRRRDLVPHISMISIFLINSARINASMHTAHAPSKICRSMGWVGSGFFSYRQITLRGGNDSADKNSKASSCPYCNKVHSLRDSCRAQRVAQTRAAQGRRTMDGWALLSVMREAKVGTPKGLSEYGWGSASYDAEPSMEGWKGDFVVLGIETSCDDTAAAVVESSGRILGESKRTQDQIHAAWGGEWLLVSCQSSLG